MSILIFLFSASGRSTRLQFWIVQAVLIILIVSLLLLMRAVSDPNTGDDPHHVSYGIYVVYPLLVWVNICACVKRYHDLGKAWYWILMILIPVIGSFLVYGETGFRRGMEGCNKYGPPPIAI